MDFTILVDPNVEVASRYTPQNDEPKMEPFTMESDMKHGRFDEDGTFIFNKKPSKRRSGGSDSEDSVDDPWLESIREEKECHSVLAKRARTHLKVIIER